MLPLRAIVDLGAIAIKGYLHSTELQHYWILTIWLFSVISGHSLGDSCPSAELQLVYSTAPADWATGHSLGESYPSAELQSAYSTAPAVWATRHSLGESYPSAELQSVYSIVSVWPPLIAKFVFPLSKLNREFRQRLWSFIINKSSYVDLFMFLFQAILYVSINFQIKYSCNEQPQISSHKKMFFFIMRVMNNPQPLTILPTKIFLLHPMT